MPIYEYRCGSCGFQKEFIQRMSDARLTQCPECHQETFNKMVTAAGFQLKGGGWYVTDFKNSGSGGSAGSGKKTEEKQTDTSAKTESAKSESKDTSASASSTAVPAAAPAASTPTPSSSN